MRKVIILLMVIAIAGTAIAQDVGSSRELPVKNSPTVTYTPPAEVKQGGDTIGTATVIPGIPYSDSGNTCMYMDDYDEECPFSSNSPDVVYSYTPGSDITVTFDLCGSGYDTKAYIYDSDMNLIVCNEDYYWAGDPCGAWVSNIEGVPLSGGTTYFLVIDGYGGECGDYMLNVTDFGDCLMTCLADAVPEGEPPLQDDVFDMYNTGCNADPPILQTIDWANTEAGEAWLCGVSGWFVYEGVNNARDTDWFSIIALGTEMTFTVQSEYPCYVSKRVAPECPSTAEFFENTSCGVPVTLTFPTTPGEEVWLLVAPTVFSGSVMEFKYFATLSGHVWDPPVSNEPMNWGGVKALYR